MANTVILDVLFTRLLCSKRALSRLFMVVVEAVWCKRGSRWTSRRPLELVGNELWEALKG